MSPRSASTLVVRPRSVDALPGPSFYGGSTLLALPGMATLHANSAREAIVKICTLPLLAGPNVSSSFVVPTVASSIDLVVHLGLERDGRRTVREISAIPGRAENEVVEIAELFVQREGELVRGDGFPPHQERFARAGYDVAQLLGDRS